MGAVAATADRTIVGEGTPEKAWQNWPGWRRGRRRALARLVPDGDRLVVVAPHPDDETLMAGGLVHDAVRAGHPVLVVAVSDGEGSHPGSARWPLPELRAVRAAERNSALAELAGGSDVAVVRRGLPDGGITADAVRPRLLELVARTDTIVVPWRYDGHPDHEAVAEAALALAGARVLQAPVWGWHWAAPDRGELPEDPLLYSLDAAAHAAKVRAVNRFVSQLQPDPSTGAGAVLPGWALRRLARATEVFFDE